MDTSAHSFGQDMELLTPLTSSLNVAEVSRLNRTAKEEARQRRGKVGRPRENEYKEAVLTNWKSPLLWHHINATAI